jgi:hypothetical protein
MAGMPPQDPSWQGGQPGGQGRPYPEQSGGYQAYPPSQPGGPDYDVSAKGFVASLFDFGFNSFVTPKVIKFIYVLYMIVIGLGALSFLIFSFKVSAIFGIIALVILCPLYFIVSLAFLRIVLEFYIVVFRMAEDIRSIRNRGGGFG